MEIIIEIILKKFRLWYTVKDDKGLIKIIIIKKNIVKRAIFCIEGISILNFSLEANLVMYTNKTIRPPKKIINRINENHLDLINDQVKMHTIKVCNKIKRRIITGWDAVSIVLLINKMIKEINLISDYSLKKKILALEVKDKLCFSLKSL